MSVGFSQLRPSTFHILVVTFIPRLLLADLPDCMSPVVSQNVEKAPYPEPSISQICAKLKRPGNNLTSSQRAYIKL